MSDLEISVLRSIAGEASVNPRTTVELVASHGVGAGDFTHGPCRRLFEAMMTQLEHAHEQLDAVATLALVGNSVPRELVLDVIAEAELGKTAARLQRLREEAANRQLLEVLRSAAGLLKASSPTATVASELRKAIDAVVTPGDTIRPYSSEVVGVIERLEAARKGQDTGVIPTGIVAFDRCLGGLQPSVLTFIGSLPSVGKSALLASICRNLGRRRVKVGFLSLEDNRDWLVRRLASEVSRIPLFTLANRPHELSPRQVERFHRALEQTYTDLETVMGEDAEERPLTLSEVIARATTMVMKHGCRAIILDHLGEVAVGRTERHDLDVLEVVTSLRSLAKTHAIPVVVAAHLRRRTGLMNKEDKPALTDFAFSAGIERVARVAVGLFRPNPATISVNVLKQTQGVADVVFDLDVLNASGTIANADRAQTDCSSIYEDPEGDRQ